MVRSLRYLENGPFKKWGLRVGFIIVSNPQSISTCSITYVSNSDSQVFNPLQVSNHFNDLLAGLLLDFNNLIILGRSKHVMHAIFSLLIKELR